MRLIQGYHRKCKERNDTVSTGTKRLLSYWNENRIGENETNISI